MQKSYKTNKTIIFCILIFFLTSVLSIYSITSNSLLFIKQITWYLIGIGIIFFITKTKNKLFYNNINILYIGTIILLGLLLIFAPSINGSKCWFVLPGIGNFQPSEFMKIFLIIILAKEVNKFNKKKKKTFKKEILFLIKIFILVLIPSIFTFLEPDTGAVIIYLVITITLLFFSDLRPWWYILFIVLFISIIGGIFYLYFYQKDMFISIFSTKLFYRLERILSWTDKTSYQLENALISQGTSGMFGYGIGHIPLYFPEGTTDFIFTSLISSFGFIGGFFLLLTIFYFDKTIIELILKSNYVDKYILIGCFGMLLYQQIQNIGMNIGLLPITGITLPFISYGGSSLISYMIIIGLLLNINYKIERKKKKDM